MEIYILFSNCAAWESIRKRLENARKKVKIVFQYCVKTLKKLQRYWAVICMKLRMNIY